MECKITSIKSLSENSKGFCFRGKAGLAALLLTHRPMRVCSLVAPCQTGLSAKTPRAAGLLPVAGVGSALAARPGDARASPPWPRPKSLAAEPLSIFKPASQARQKLPTVIAHAASALRLTLCCASCRRKMNRLNPPAGASEAGECRADRAAGAVMPRYPTPTFAHQTAERSRLMPARV